jgi:hypothetical protein
MHQICSAATWLLPLLTAFLLLGVVIALEEIHK